MPKVSFASSKLVRVLLGCAYSLSLFVVGHLAIFPWEQQASTPEQLRHTNRLLVQQVDSLSMNYLNGLPTDRPLTSSEREAVDTWLRYDKQFVELQRDSEMQSFECATAARRVGFASGLLGDTQTAENYLLISINKFDWLGNEYEAGVSYRFEEASARLQLAMLYSQTGQLTLARKHVDEAISGLKVEQLPPIGEFVTQIAQTYIEAARLLVALGEKESAKQLLAANQQQLESVNEGMRDPSSALGLLIKKSRQLASEISGD